MYTKQNMNLQKTKHKLIQNKTQIYTKQNINSYKSNPYNNLLQILLYSLLLKTLSIHLNLIKPSKTPTNYPNLTKIIYISYNYS